MHLDSLSAFSTHRRELLDGERKAELARNLETLIQIRDDPGENSAADRTVRLKAIQVIEGSDGKASVTVNVNQQTNVAAIQPGYVIRLGKFSREPAIEQEREPLTIDQG